MTFSLTEMRLTPGDDLYYDAAFRRVIETHLEILRRSAAQQTEDVTADVVWRYQGDFYGFLGSKGVPFQQRWLYLRVNGFTASHEFGNTFNDPYTTQNGFTLYHPPMEIVRDLRRLHLTVVE